MKYITNMPELTECKTGLMLTLPYSYMSYCMLNKISEIMLIISAKDKMPNNMRQFLCASSPEASEMKIKVSLDDYADVSCTR